MHSLEQHTDLRRLFNFMAARRKGKIDWHWRAGERPGLTSIMIKFDAIHGSQLCAAMWHFIYIYTAALSIYPAA